MLQHKTGQPAPAAPHSPIDHDRPIRSHEHWEQPFARFI